MANKKAYARVRPIIHEYLMDLAKLGPYGKGKSGVVRRLIETGIAAALESGVIPKRHVADFGEPITEDDDEEDGDD